MLICKKHYVSQKKGSPYFYTNIFMYTLLIFSLQTLQVFTVSQIPLQFHCIFYRQPTVNIFLQFLHTIFALFVCKKCSETAVGFVHSEKPVVFAVKILAV